MSIQDNSKSANAGQPAGGFNMGAGAAAPQPEATTQSNTGPRSFASMFSTPIGRFSGSESIKDLETKLNELYKNSGLPAQMEYGLISLDNQNNAGLAFGALVVCLVNKEKAPNAVAFHTLIIEATAAPLPSRVINENGVQVEILNPPSAAWDSTLANAVAKAVGEKYRNKTPMMVDACVVPRTFNAAIQPDLYKLAYNAIVACSTEIDMRAPGFQDVNLATMQKGNLTVSLTVATKQEPDDVGQPQRSNVEVVYQDNLQTQNVNANAQYSVNTQERSTLIGSANGFIDFSWAPAVTAAPYAQMYTQQQLPGGLLPSHKFAARLVLTKISPDAVATPPAILNLIAPMLAVVEDMSWVQTFMNRGVKSRHHDIGALNVEGNLGGDLATGGLGKKVDTSSDDFTVDKLYQFVGSLVRPGLAIAIDVPDAGPQTWFLSLFAMAASGQVSAVQHIIDAANTLTAGNFGRSFPAGAQVFVDPGNRVHLGTYDNNGVLEDVRNVDYLAVANSPRIAENADILRKYTDTFQAVDHLSLNRRLDERARIIKEVVPSVNFTGFATRVTFSAEFIQALWAGIKACGVSPTVSRHGMSTGPQVNRAGASFASHGMLLPGQINAFNQGQSGGPRFTNSGQSNFTGRW